MTTDVQDQNPSTRHARHLGHQLKEAIPFEMMREFHGHDEIEGSGGERKSKSVSPNDVKRGTVRETHRGRIMIQRRPWR